MRQAFPIGFYLNMTVFLPMYSGDDESKYLAYVIALWHGLILLNGTVVFAIRRIFARTVP